MDRTLRNAAFRLAFAALVLAAHLSVMSHLGRDRMRLAFNSSPKSPPSFQYPDAPLIVRGDSPSKWDRLLPSRWDAQHYIAIVERGYSLCPPQDLRDKSLLASKVNICEFSFYPGYPAMAWVVMKATRLSSDYALLAVSLAASLLFLFLFTGPTMTRSLGLHETYVALILFNGFATGFALVTMQTEPVTLLAMLLAFLALRRRYYLLGAFAAGAAGAFRVTGTAVGLAYGCALFWIALTDASEPALRRWGRLFPAAVLCAWGQLALCLYFGIRYKDPFIYFNSHLITHGGGIDFWAALLPTPRIVMRSLTMGHHEGIFIAFSFVWLGLGYRRAMKGFASSERVFWTAMTAASVGIALIGSAGLAYAGMNRYWLMTVPLFFAMACALKARPVALVAWLAFSGWHYYNVDLCVYLAQWQTPSYCNMDYVP